MKGKRSLYEIYWEILTYCKNPRTFTSIINRCALNSKTAQEYLEFLTRKSYIAQIEEDNRNHYRITKQADEFLIPFKTMYLELYNKSPEFRL